MATNNFNIVISATDKATASIRKVNDSISKMTRPFQNIQRSMNNLTKELNRNPVVKGLKSIGAAALDVAESIAKIAAPMAALVGVGSIAGLGMLVSEWGRLGFEITRTSSLLGMSAFSLHSLRGAATLAGVSTSELNGGLGALRQNLQDAKWGRNPALAALMSRLGMQFRDTADGAVDVVHGFEDISRAIQSQRDIGAKHTIAQAFGVESLLPLLMKGPEEIKRLQAESAKLNPFMDPARAEAYARSVFKMDAAFSGLKNTIGNALLPAMEPLVSLFTQLITKNKEAIGSKIGEWAEKLGKWLAGLKKEDFDQFENKLTAIGNAVVFVAESLGTLIAKLESLQRTTGNRNFLGPFTPMIRLAEKLFGDGGEKSTRVASGKIQDASGVAQAVNSASSALPLGIRNNNPLNLQPGGREASFGSAQEGIEAGIRNIVKNYRGLTLAQYVHKYAPGNGVGNSAASEVGYLRDLSSSTGIGADQVPNLTDPNVLSRLVSAHIRHENGQNPYSKDMVNDAVSHVIVEFKNAPAGMLASAKAKNGVSVPVRISHSLPTLAAG